MRDLSVIDGRKGEERCFLRMNCAMVPIILRTRAQERRETSCSRWRTGIQCQRV